MAGASIQDLIALNQEILAIARAKAPIAAELAAAARQMPSGAAMLAELIAHELERGKPLDQAVAAQQARLPRFYTAVVAAGVNSGKLTSALEGLSESLTRMQALRWRVLNSFSYPLFVASMAWVLAVAAARTFAPRFDWVDPSMPPTLEWLRADGVGFWLLLVSVPLVLFGAELFTLWGSARTGRSYATGLGVLDRLPGVNSACRSTASANFADLLSLLVAHRTPMPDALRMAADAVDWRPLTAAAGGLASEIEVGHPIAAGGASLRLLPPLVRMALLTGADADSMAALLQQAAQSYHRRALSAINGLSLLLPAATTATIGGVAVAAYGLLMLGPYFSALNKLALP
ncbi:Type II secretion system protein F [Posidoniimonas polymericola]|uniref:Type II secretion system protein F n=1 Tax=Posidoniimonas polymericola TaxID=2528002 RepID=A0A5C5YHC0_9BACT|nr:type II secretion system F family protein [Posidoniimonas polymericola]TWT74513.1 Type II secretion system protein F [Posidoniimonas polymericola]